MSAPTLLQIVPTLAGGGVARATLEAAQAQLFSAIGVYQPCKKGLMLYSQTDDLAWCARQLARLDCRFEVIAPASLKTAVARHATRLLRFTKA